MFGFYFIDWLKMMVFFCCNDDYYVIVFVEVLVDGFNYIVFLFFDFEFVMCGLGCVKDVGYLIGWGVGCYGLGDNVFVYFVDLIGVVIEYIVEVLQVDDIYLVGGFVDWVWLLGWMDYWGIVLLKSEECKKVQVLVLFFVG